MKKDNKAQIYSALKVALAYIKYTEVALIESGHKQEQGTKQVKKIIEDAMKKARGEK